MIRAYLTPFDYFKNFAEEIEVTDDVDFDSLGTITQSLDSSEYDIGVLRFNNINLKLNNRKGLYSDVENIGSIFRAARSGSKVRLTWSPGEESYCGFVTCGEDLLSEEVTLYEGILNDDSTVMSADDLYVPFQVLSYDSIFSNILAPFEEIKIGDKVSEIILKICSSPAVTKYFSVLEENISLGLDPEINSVEFFEDKTAKEALEPLLLVSNSVLFVEDGVMYVQTRQMGEELKASFYGQASILGPENILDLTDFRNGHNRIFNLVRWKDNTASSKNTASIDRWGAKVKELDVEFITDPAVQSQIAAALVGEFKDPKNEFKVSSSMDHESTSLRFLDRVSVDYPVAAYAKPGKELPIVGRTKIGDPSAPLPELMWRFSIDPGRKFKVMERSFDLKKEISTISVRGA